MLWRDLIAEIPDWSLNEINSGPLPCARPIAKTIQKLVAPCLSSKNCRWFKENRKLLQFYTICVAILSILMKMLSGLWSWKKTFTWKDRIKVTYRKGEGKDRTLLYRPTCTQNYIKIGSQCMPQLEDTANDCAADSAADEAIWKKNSKNSASAELLHSDEKWTLYIEKILKNPKIENEYRLCEEEFTTRRAQGTVGKEGKKLGSRAVIIRTS